MTVNIDGNLLPKHSDDAIGPALLVAVAVHAFLLLSISFDVSRDTPPPPERTLDITLVQPKPKPKPVEAPDFLAQQDQEGGGDKTVKERQTSPLGNPAALPKPQWQKEPR